MSLSTDGNVGLGARDPKQALVVDGSIQLLGGIDFGDGGRQKKAAVAASIVVGGVVEWWNAGNPATHPPPEFMYCDGRRIDDPDSPFHGQCTPNLIGRAIKGTTTDVEIGATGGSATHVHDLGQVPPHTHPMSHDHREIACQTNGDTGPGVGSISRHFNALGHSHGFDIALDMSEPSNSMVNGPNPTTSTDPASTWPAAVGLMMIVRVK